jgi:hypothetical protein
VRSLLPHTKDLACATDKSPIRDRCVSLPLRLLFLFNEGGLCSSVLRRTGRTSRGRRLSMMGFGLCLDLRLNIYEDWLEGVFLACGALKTLPPTDEFRRFLGS